MIPDFDVIVAGGGAGGAAAACFLCQRGLRVLVVEKARVPRHKPCGGAVPRHLLEGFPFSLQGVVRARPEVVRFEHPPHAPVEVPLPGLPVAMVLRSELDARLLEGSGAELMDATEVTGIEEGETGVRVRTAPTATTAIVPGRGERLLTARYLVGADGASSQVARWLGLRSGRKVGGCLEAEVQDQDRPELGASHGRGALFSLGAVPRGYAWVFPKGDRLSVGIGRLAPGQVDLRGALRATTSRLGIALEGVELHGHPIACYQAPRWPWREGHAQETLSTRRCLLVGEAAGLVDPLIGEGIRYAVASARLAAEAVARDDLQGYEMAVWREIGHSLATCRMVADLYYRWPGACFGIGVRNPAVTGLILDVLCERASYVGVGRRLAAATLSWLVRVRGRKTSLPIDREGRVR